jgi:Mn2+/Fe2+ NRAMP family transporter
MSSDYISHGTPEMLFAEIAATAAGAAFHAQMLAEYASVGNTAGTLFALRSLIACTKAAAATGKDLKVMKEEAQSHAA